MDYEEMFEAIEKKLIAELRIYKEILVDHEKRGFENSYLAGNINMIENIAGFTEELKRIKEDL